MNFPQFWARGKSGDFLVWRWSLQSLEEAQARADQAAQQLADRFRVGDYPPRHGAYYPNRPFREQILREVKGRDGQSCALITRNSYGCLVLNTARVMFVDIDLPEPERSEGFFQRLFGKPAQPQQNGQADQALRKVQDWTRSNSDWGWRVYRTRAGLRLLATQATVDPGGEQTETVFAALGADPLYRKLCTTQKCFRARLTPKPWRCGLYAKPTRWPWLDAAQERRFQKWDARYQTANAAWATCARLPSIGNTAIDPEVQTIIDLHDGPTRADSGLQLA